MQQQGDLQRVAVSFHDPTMLLVDQFANLGDCFNVDLQNQFKTELQLCCVGLTLDAENIIPHTEVELKNIIMKFIAANVQIKERYTGQSGIHTNNPHNFCGAALKAAKATTVLTELGLFYFYFKTFTCPDYDSKFSPFLKEGLKGDSDDLDPEEMDATSERTTNNLSKVLKTPQRKHNKR